MPKLMIPGNRNARWEKILAYNAYRITNIRYPTDKRWDRLTNDEENILADRVRQAIACLPQPLRDVVETRYRYRKTYADIGQICGITMGRASALDNDALYILSCRPLGELLFLEQHPPLNDRRYAAIQNLAPLAERLPWRAIGKIAESGFYDLKSIAETDVSRLFTIRSIGEKTAATAQEIACRITGTPNSMAGLPKTKPIGTIPNKKETWEIDKTGTSWTLRFCDDFYVRASETNNGANLFVQLNRAVTDGYPMGHVEATAMLNKPSGPDWKKDAAADVLDWAKDQLRRLADYHKDAWLALVNNKAFRDNEPLA